MLSWKKPIPKCCCRRGCAARVAGTPEPVGPPSHRVFPNDGSAFVHLGPEKQASPVADGAGSFVHMLRQSDRKRPGLTQDAAGTSGASFHQGPWSRAFPRKRKIKAGMRTTQETRQESHTGKGLGWRGFTGHWAQPLAEEAGPLTALGELRALLP